jgi:hypothetical protein
LYPEKAMLDSVAADSTNVLLHNIELSSAADYAQRVRFLTGLHLRLKTASKATAPTICYLDLL